MRRTVRIGPEACLVLLLLAFSLQTSWFDIQQRPGIDYYDFWVVSQAARSHPGINVYSAESRALLGREFMDKSLQPGVSERQRMVARLRKQIDPVSTPFLYTVFALVVTGDYESDFLRYEALALVCYLAAIAFLGYSVGCPPATLLAAGAVFSYWLTPYVSESSVGNVNQIQLAFLALFLFLRYLRPFWGRDSASATVLGAIVCFKPNLAAVAVFYVLFAAVNRRYRKTLFTFVGVMVGATFAVGVSSLFFGSIRCWKNWTAVLPRVIDALHPVSKGNFSLSRIVFEWTHRDVSRPLFGATLVLVGVAIAIARRSPNGPDAKSGRSREYREDFLSVAMGCVAVLLSSRLVWLHYYLLTIPILLYSLRPQDGHCRESALTYWVRIVCSTIAVFLLSSLVVPVRAGWGETAFWAVRAISAAVLLGVLGVVQVLSLREPRSAAPAQSDDATVSATT